MTIVTYDIPISVWRGNPIRVSRGYHECKLCNKLINKGDKYSDRGFGRRAHVECVDKLFKK